VRRIRDKNKEIYLSTTNIFYQHLVIQLPQSRLNIVLISSRMKRVFAITFSIFNPILSR